MRGTITEQVRAAVKTIEYGRYHNVAHIAHRIYKETHSGGDYLLRDIPEDLWQKAKHRAVDDNDKLRDLVLKALHTYLK